MYFNFAVNTIEACISWIVHRNIQQSVVYITLPYITLQLPLNELYIFIYIHIQNPKLCHSLELFCIVIRSQCLVLKSHRWLNLLVVTPGMCKNRLWCSKWSTHDPPYHSKCNDILSNRIGHFYDAIRSITSETKYLTFQSSMCQSLGTGIGARTGSNKSHGIGVFSETRW